MTSSVSELDITNCDIQFVYVKLPSMPSELIPQERIENKILVIRGRKVMIDRDLAQLYGVQTEALNQAVKRNKNRFPADFMFRLNLEEIRTLRSQNVISKFRRGGMRYVPAVFTEQGVAMLSSVLKSKRAIQVNIQIMRTFTKLREMLLENTDLRRKIELMEKQYDEQFRMVFDAIRRLLDDGKGQDPQIGFKAE